MKRRSIHGWMIDAPTFKTRCAECGMSTLDLHEFHPYEACVEFKRTHDSRTVEALLEHLWASNQESRPE